MCSIVGAWSNGFGGRLFSRDFKQFFLFGVSHKPAHGRRKAKTAMRQSLAIEAFDSLFSNRVLCPARGGITIATTGALRAFDSGTHSNAR
jgi:hypothetical protein